MKKGRISSVFKFFRKLSIWSKLFLPLRANRSFPSKKNITKFKLNFLKFILINFSRNGQILNQMNKFNYLMEIWISDEEIGLEICPQSITACLCFTVRCLVSFEKAWEGMVGWLVGINHSDGCRALPMDANHPLSLSCSSSSFLILVLSITSTRENAIPYGDKSRPRHTTAPPRFIN